jgi:ATP-binding cassette subfamily B protein
MGAKHGKEASANVTLKASAHGSLKDAGMVGELKKVPVLATYCDHELATLGAALLLHHYSEGDFLCKEGDKAEGMFIIKSGWCRLTRTQDDGSHREIGQLKDGDYFEEMALTNKSLRGATIKADTDVTAFFLRRTDFQRLFDATV